MGSIFDRGNIFMTDIEEYLSEIATMIERSSILRTKLSMKIMPSLQKALGRVTQLHNSVTKILV